MAANISLEDLQKMKVADLKKELKVRGLSQVGNKTELIERLQVSYERGSPSLDNEELLDDDDDDDDLADESLEDDLAAIKDEESTHVTLSTKRKLEVPAQTAALPLKKIVLNRTAVSAIEDNLEEVKDEAVAVPAAATTVVPSKGGVKITTLTTKERLELRASKFGVALTADAKKEARAARFGVTSATTTATAAAAPPNVEALKKRAERFGGSVSSTLTKVELDEKLKKRQERFGVVTAPSKDKVSAKENGSARMTTTTSTSVKVPITMGNSVVDDKKQQRAERFKATL